MAKQLNQVTVNLAVTADTKQAQANLQALSKSLSEISNIRPTQGLPLKKEIQEAVNSAKSLETHLSNAFNQKTGNLDLKMLNKSLSKSGESLQGLTTGLLNCGLQGEKAFMNVQRSIATAGVQINKTQGLLGEFFTTLKNTARWQLSSSLLHGMIGQFNQAIGYAKDLDKSLNNIRIVTGYSAEEMSKFAKEANVAAKALRTTTAEYTDAALIYYQQGLSDKEVKERTDITVKMANIARESAETVSDQLTAVWNNFSENGTQSLEHYADAMTKLGAETASSTDEIAGGLEKFASVADMIGLSFDNAAAALATITATTRQSEDVVGTALKTIFARIQGLNLGETLDDGTTLNKYSEALAKVGISIYDAGGGLKEMDKILDEMGNKWKTLSDNQQVALAQTVAGVRQYNQLVSLMENFDTYRQNVSLAQNSDGELNKQQKIYEESWEAAREKVRASLEGLYDDLIPTDSIIKMTEGFAKGIEVVDYLVEGLGGLEGILLLISTIAINKFGPSLAQGINVGIDNTKNLIGQFSQLSLRTNTTRDTILKTGEALETISGQGLKTAVDQTKYFNDNLKASSSEMLKMQQSSIAQAATQSNMTDQFKIYLADVSKVNNLQAIIERNSANLTVAQKEKLAAQQQELLNLADAKSLEQERLENLRLQKEAMLDLGDTSLFDSADYNEYYSPDAKYGSSFDTIAIRSEEVAKSWAKVLESSQGVTVEVHKTEQGIRYTSEKTSGIASASKGALAVFENLATVNQKIKNIMSDSNIPLNERKKAIYKIIEAERQSGRISQETARAYNKGTYHINEGVNGAKSLNDAMSNSERSAARFAQSLGNTQPTITKVATIVTEIVGSESRLATLNNQFNNSLSKTTQLLQSNLRSALSIGGTLSKMAGGFSTVAMGITSVSNAFEQLKEGELNVTTASMALVSGLQAAMVTMKGLQTLTTTSIVKNKLLAAAKGELTAASLAEVFVTQLGIEKTKAETIANNFLTASKGGATKATIAQTMANLGLQASLLPIIATIAAVAAAAFLLYKAFQWTKAQSPEYKLEQAENRAKALQEALNEAKTAADELKSAFDKYDEVKNTLDDCVKGTEEWTDALKENNNAVLDLMSKYPELSSMVNEAGQSAITRNADGALEIADWAQERLENEAQYRVNAAQAASIAGQQEVRQAQSAVKTSEVYSDYYAKTGYFGTTKSTVNEAGQVVSTTDVNSDVQSAILGNMSSYSKMSRDEVYESLSKLFEENGWGTETIDNWTNAIVDMGPEFRGLAESIDANTKALETENDIIAASALENNANIQSSKYKDDIINASGEIYNELYKKEMESLEKGGYGTAGLNKSHGIGGNAKKYWNEYLQAAGLNANDYKLVDTTGTDANRQFVYRQGDEEKKIDLQTMKVAIASARAMEKLGESAEYLMKEFIRLGSVAEDTDKGKANRGLISFLSGKNLEGATRGQFDSLTKDVGGDDNVVTKEESDQYLIDNFGENGVITDEIAKRYGFETAEKMKTGFYESMQLDWETIELPDTLVNTDSLSFSASQAFETIYEGLEKGLEDKEGIDPLTNVLNGFDFTHLDTSEQTAVWDQLANIDWSNWDAVEQAANIVTEAGGIIKDVEWETLTANLRDATDAVPDLVAMKEELNAIDEIAKDISLGDIISEEDYQTLMKYNSELSKYFTILSDGSAQFTGDQLDFQQDVKRNKMGALASAGIAYQDRAGELNDQYNKQLAIMGGEDFESFSSNALNTKGYYGAKAKNQVEFLANQGYDEEQISKWEDELSKGPASVETINAISEAVASQQSAFEGTKAQADAYMATYQATMNEVALLAEDSSERLALLQEGFINQEAYDRAVNAAINTEAWEDLDVAAVQEYASYLEDTFDFAEEESEEVARSISKMNKGVNTLADNWENWGDILKTGNKEGKEASKLSQEYVEAMQGTKKALSDVLDVSEDFISTDFISSAENLELIEKAAKGDAEAIDELGRKLSEDIAISAFKATDAFKGITDTVEANTKLEEFKTKLQEVADFMQSRLGANALDLGDTIGGEDALFTKLQEVVSASQMTAEQANAYYRSMGFTPNFKMVEVTQAESVPITTTYHSREVSKYDEYNNPIEWTDKEWSNTEQVDGGEVVSQLPSLAMATNDGQVMVPSTEIESVTYTGGGSLNNFSSTNTGGPPAGGGGKKSKKEKKDPNKDIERYHTITKEIEDLNKELSRTEAKKDQAFGKSKLPFIQDEINTIDQLIAKNKEYQSEIKKMSDYDWSQISGYGFIDANSDGILDNWYEIQEKMMKEYNDAVEKFNKDGDEATFEAAEKRYNDFLDLVEQYEETQGALEDAIDEGAELERKRIERELELITAEVDFEIEINQRDLDKLDYSIDKLNRTVGNMVEVIDKMGTQVGAYENQSKAARDGIERIKQNAEDEGRELTDDEQRQIWAYEDQLLDINTSLMDLVETVENSVLEEFERMSDEIDKNIGRFDTYSEAIDHYTNIIKLSGRQTKDSMLLMELAAQKTDIAMEKLNASRDKYLAQQSAQANAKTNLDAAIASKNQKDIDYWQKQYDDITMTVEESHNEMLASWEETLEAAGSQFDLAIESTIQTLKDSIGMIDEFGNVIGLDNLADRYEKAKETQELYLSNLDKEYELNKLNRQIQDSIDGTDNIIAKEKLLELQKEINEKMAEGVEMSQYDLEYMQKKYDLELAKIALEEAQNAKSTVRLSRDSEGNFGYVYTADQDQIDNAQQNYEDKLHDLKKHSEEYLDDMSEKIIQNQQDMMEVLAAIDKTKFETQEEYEAELDRIKAHYMGLDKYYRSEMQKAMDELGVTYQETLLGQLEGSASLDEAQKTLQENTDTATKEMGTAWATWHASVDKSMEEAGTSSETFTEDIKDDMEDIEDATDDLADNIDDKTKDMTEDIDELMQKVKEWRDDYLQKIQDMIDANEKLALSEGKEPSEINVSKSDDEDGKGSDSDDGTGGKSGDTSKGSYTVQSGDTLSGIASAHGLKTSALYNKNKSIIESTAKSRGYDDSDNGHWIFPGTVLQLKTGGYTGEWGPEGKLAILHEKEMVLNANDTENLLQTISFIRDIISQIDTQANMASLFNMSPTSGISAMNEVLEQTVTIHAEFPNATNHSEIEEAFKSLVNRASQYANRK